MTGQATRSLFLHERTELSHGDYTAVVVWKRIVAAIEAR